MAFQLHFTHQEKYNSRDIGINIKATLRYGELFLVCDAKIDTGAEVCLFERVIGEALEVPIEYSEAYHGKPRESDESPNAKRDDQGQEPMMVAAAHQGILERAVLTVSDRKVRAYDLPAIFGTGAQGDFGEGLGGGYGQP